MVPNAHLLEELVHVALFDESQWALPDVSREIVASIRHRDMNQPTCTGQCVSVAVVATWIYLSYFMFLQIILYLPALINFASWFAMSRIRDTWWHGHISGHLRTHTGSLCVSRCVMLCLPLSEPGLTQREVISWRRDKGLVTRPKSKPCPEAKCNASTLHILHILHMHPKPT